MSTTDTEFYRDFAARVRTQLATTGTAHEGSPTMDTTAAETTEAPAAAAERLMNSDPCDNAWCLEGEAHTWCYGREVGLPPVGEPTTGGAVLLAYLQHDRRAGETFVNYSLTDNDDTRFRTGDEMRAETARVRAHLTRLDALADQLDAITEAAGSPVAAVAGHFPWCAPGGCIAHHDDDASWTEHEGRWNKLPARGPDSEPLLKSALYFSAAFTDAPEVGVSFRGEGKGYSAPEADALIAGLETFLDGLKAQRAQLDGEFEGRGR